MRLSRERKINGYGAAEEKNREIKSEEILRWYDQELKKHPKDVGIWHAKGMFLLKEGRFEDAFKCFENILKLDPDHHKAREIQAEIAFNLGMFDEALRSYDILLKTNKKSEEYWHKKGRILEIRGDYEGALFCYNKALEVNSTYIPALHSKGSVLRAIATTEVEGAETSESLAEHPKIKEALELVNKVLLMDPTSVEAHITKGDIMYTIGKFLESLQEYNTGSRIAPRDPVAEERKGRALLAMGDTREALKTFKEVLELPERSSYYTFPEILSAKANACFMREDLEGALKFYNKILEIDLNNQRALLHKAEVLERMGNLSEALECYERVVQQNPNNVQAIGRAREITECKGANKQITRRHSAQADTTAWIKEARRYTQNGEYEKAERYLRKALEMLKEDLTLWFELGCVLEHMAKHEEALKCFERAIRISPKFNDALLMAGKTAFLLGRRKTAEKYLLQALINDPTNEVIRTLLFEIKGVQLKETEMGEDIQPLENILIGNRNEEGRREDIEVELEITPDDDRLWYRYATELLREKRHEEALLAIDRAIKLNPTKPEYWMVKAEVYYATAHYTASKKYARKALELLSESEKNEADFYKALLSITEKASGEFVCPVCGFPLPLRGCICKECGTEIEEVDFKNTYGGLPDSLFLFYELATGLKNGTITFVELDAVSGVLKYLIKEGGKYRLVDVKMSCLNWDTPPNKCYRR